MGIGDLFFFTSGHLSVSFDLGSSRYVRYRFHSFRGVYEIK